MKIRPFASAHFGIYNILNVLVLRVLTHPLSADALLVHTSVCIRGIRVIVT